MIHQHVHIFEEQFDLSALENLGLWFDFSFDLFFFVSFFRVFVTVPLSDCLFVCFVFLSFSPADPSETLEHHSQLEMETMEKLEKARAKVSHIAVTEKCAREEIDKSQSLLREHVEAVESSKKEVQTLFKQVESMKSSEDETREKLEYANARADLARRYELEVSSFLLPSLFFPSVHIECRNECFFFSLLRSILGSNSN